MDLQYSPKAPYTINGKPNARGLLTFWNAGTSLPVNVYSDKACTVSAGPYAYLDVDGALSTQLYLKPGVEYEIRMYRPVSVIMVPAYDPDDPPGSDWAFVYSWRQDVMSTADTIQYAMKVDTISDLMDITPAENMIVNVYGYYSIGDCPVRTYVWNSSDLRSTNRGTIIGSNVSAAGRWNLTDDVSNGIPSYVFGDVPNQTEVAYDVIWSGAAAVADSFDVPLIIDGNFPRQIDLSIDKTIALNKLHITSGFYADSTNTGLLIFKPGEVTVDFLGSMRYAKLDLSALAEEANVGFEQLYVLNNGYNNYPLANVVLDSNETLTSFGLLTVHDIIGTGTLTLSLGSLVAHDIARTVSIEINAGGTTLQAHEMYYASDASSVQYKSALTIDRFVVDEFYTLPASSPCNYSNVDFVFANGEIVVPDTSAFYAKSVTGTPGKLWLNPNSGLSVTEGVVFDDFDWPNTDIANSIVQIWKTNNCVMDMGGKKLTIRNNADNGVRLPRPEDIGFSDSVCPVIRNGAIDQATYGLQIAAPVIEYSSVVFDIDVKVESISNGLGGTDDGKPLEARVSNCRFIGGPLHGMYKLQIGNSDVSRNRNVQIVNNDFGKTIIKMVGNWQSYGSTIITNNHWTNDSAVSPAIALIDVSQMSIYYPAAGRPLNNSYPKFTIKDNVPTSNGVVFSTLLDSNGDLSITSGTYVPTTDLTVVSTETLTGTDTKTILTKQTGSQWGFILFAPSWTGLLDSRRWVNVDVYGCPQDDVNYIYAYPLTHDKIQLNYNFTTDDEYRVLHITTNY